MDADLFDHLARVLTDPRPRRAFAGLVLGGLLVTAHPTESVAKKKKKSGKTKYMKAAEEPNPIGDWFKKTFSTDDKTARKRTSATD